MENTMKGGAVIALAFILLAPGAYAADYRQGDGGCLYPDRIDYTDVLDENTIIFHMRDGTVLTSKLPRRCPGIRFYGFSYVLRGTNELCANFDSVRVLKTGSVCQLGPFEATSPPKSAD
ncbi:MAG: hypothetical protein ACT4OG_04520 [Alphaproteobacteria bacterium]